MRAWAAGLSGVLAAAAPAAAARRPGGPTAVVDAIVSAVHPAGEDSSRRHFLAEVRVLRVRRGKPPKRLFMRVSLDKELRARGRRDIPLEPGQLFRGLLIPVRRSLFRQATYGIADIPDTEDADTDLGSIGGVAFVVRPDWGDGLHRSQEFNFERFHLPPPGPGAKAEGATLTVTYASDLLGPAPMRYMDLWADALGPRRGPRAVPECGVTTAGWERCLTRHDGRWEGGYWGTPGEAYAVIGAIVLAPRGALLLRLFGPKAAVDARERDFRDLVDGLKPVPERAQQAEVAFEAESSTDAVPSLTPEDLSD